MALQYITGGTTGDKIKDAFAKTNEVIANTIVSASTSGSTLILTNFSGVSLTTSLPESDMLISSAITGSVIYVDPSNSNATDTRTSLSQYNFIKPFATLEAAISAATAGDTVAIISDCLIGDNGTIVNNLFKDGITITDLGTGSKVSYSGDCYGFMFDLSGQIFTNFSVLGNLIFENSTSYSADPINNLSGVFGLYSGYPSSSDDELYSLTFQCLEVRSSHIGIYMFPTSTHFTNNNLIDVKKILILPNTGINRTARGLLLAGFTTLTPNKSGKVRVGNIIDIFDDTQTYTSFLLEIRDNNLDVEIGSVYSVSKCLNQIYGNSGSVKINNVLHTGSGFFGYSYAIYNNTGLINVANSKFTGYYGYFINNSNFEFDTIYNTFGYCLTPYGNGQKVIRGNYVESTNSEAIWIGVDGENKLYPTLFDIKKIIGNSNRGVVLCNTISSGLLYDSLTLGFLGNTYIQNKSTSNGSAGIVARTNGIFNNFVSMNMVVHMGGNMDIILSATTAYPIYSYNSATLQPSTYILKEGNLSSSHDFLTPYPYTGATDYIQRIEPTNINVTYPLTAETVFSYAFFYGKTATTVTYSGATGQTKQDVRDGMKSAFDAITYPVWNGVQIAFTSTTFGTDAFDIQPNMPAHVGYGYFTYNANNVLITDIQNGVGQVVDMFNFINSGELKYGKTYFVRYGTITWNAVSYSQGDTFTPAFGDPLTYTGNGYIEDVSKTILNKINDNLIDLIRR